MNKQRVRVSGCLSENILIFSSLCPPPDGDILYKIPAFHVEALPPVVADVEARLARGTRAQLTHLLVIRLRPPAQQSPSSIVHTVRAGLYAVSLLVCTACTPC